MDQLKISVYRFSHKSLGKEGSWEKVVAYAKYDSIKSFVFNRGLHTFIVVRHALIKYLNHTNDLSLHLPPDSNLLPFPFPSPFLINRFSTPVDKNHKSVDTDSSLEVTKVLLFYSREFPAIIQTSRGNVRKVKIFTFSG